MFYDFLLHGLIIHLETSPITDPHLSVSRQGTGWSFDLSPESRGWINTQSSRLKTKPTLGIYCTKYTYIYILIYIYITYLNILQNYIQNNVNASIAIFFSPVFFGSSPFWMPLEPWIFDRKSRSLRTDLHLFGGSIVELLQRTGKSPHF